MANTCCDPHPDKDIYLDRLAAQAEIGIRVEMECLRRNRTAVSDARERLREHLSADRHASVTDDLRRLDNILSALSRCIEAGFDRDTRAVCELMPGDVRRRILGAGITAISVALPPRDRPWGEDALEQAEMLREACFYDGRALFSALISARFGRLERDPLHAPAGNEWYHENQRRPSGLPDHEDPPWIWCSYVAELTSGRVIDLEAPVSAFRAARPVTNARYDRIPEKGIYLDRLASEAEPEIRREIERLKRNITSVPEAGKRLRGHLPADLSATVAYDLRVLDGNLASLSRSITEAFGRDRRKVCMRMPGDVRRRTLGAGIAAISARPPAPSRPWGEAELEHAEMLREAYRFDRRALFSALLETEYGRLGRDPLHAVPGEGWFDENSKHLPGLPGDEDPPSVWCAYVAKFRSDLEIHMRATARPSLEVEA